MSPTDLTEARRVAETIDKATPGPWEALPDKPNWRIYGNRRGLRRFTKGSRYVCFVAGSLDDTDESTEANAKAIVTARNEAPDWIRALADEVERLQSLLAEVK